jgi:hypothetical protein
MRLIYIISDKQQTADFINLNTLKRRNLIMNQTLSTKIVLRNDNTANWDSVKDTAKLLAGEIGIEFDPNTEAANKKVRFKIGDGESTWAELPYFGGDVNKTFQVGALSEISDTDLAVGDTAIVKTAIYVDENNVANSKYSYTGYVWSGSNWAAMDGNYNAENVYFAEDFTLAGDYTSIGNVKLTDGTLRASGMSVQDLFTKVFTKELNPRISNPDFSISAAGSVTKEVGDTYDMPTATATVTATGSYSYGSATKDTNGNLTDVDSTDTSTGVTYNITVSNDRTSDTITKSGMTTSSSNNKVKLEISENNLDEEDAGLAGLVVKDDPISYIFTASATYTGATRYPLTNLKNEYKAADGSSKEIKADTAANEKTATATISGYRNYWYGFVNDADYSKISRDASTNKVTDGSGKELKAGGKAIVNGTLQVPSATQSAGTLESSSAVLTSVDGNKAFVILVPSAADKTVTSATLPQSLNAGADFTKHPKELQIAGLNGYKSGTDGAYGNNEYYDVLIYAPASMPAGTELAISVGTDTNN